MPRLGRAPFGARMLRRLLPACGYDRQGAASEWRWLQASLTPPGGTLPPSQRQRILERAVTDRVVHRKPLQYILGTQPFGDLDIITRPPTLIPRWETEEWTMRLVDLLKAHPIGRPLRILELCTGTGCISLGLAAHMPAGSVEVIGVDVSSEALALAKDNLQKHSEMLRGNGVRFIHGDLYRLESLPPGPFDLIVANPPYVTAEEWTTLAPEVRVWEDRGALVAEERGLACYSAIIRSAPALLGPSPGPQNLPCIVFECGEGQTAPIQSLLASAGFPRSIVWHDLAGKDRVTLTLPDSAQN